MELAIPRERLPQEVLSKELSRFEEIGVDVHLNTKVNRKLFNKIYKDTRNRHRRQRRPRGPRHQVPRLGGCHPRHRVPQGDQLRRARDRSQAASSVVVIGAGNVGMDIACQAWNLGAAEVTAVDIQPPASFGKERADGRGQGHEDRLAARSPSATTPKRKRSISRTAAAWTPTRSSSPSARSPVLDFLPAGMDIERGYLVVDETRPDLRRQGLRRRRRHPAGPDHQRHRPGTHHRRSGQRPDDGS